MSCARTRASCGACSPAARTRRAKRVRPLSSPCTSAWALSAAVSPYRLLAGNLRALRVTGVLHYADVEPVAVFLVAAAALAGLAWVIGLATEAVGARFGPALTGVLQSTLGNLPELFVVIFALSAGEVVVAQTSILGSLFANALLVLGLAIVAGSMSARWTGSCASRARLPNDTATLLLLAVFIIVLLGLSNTVGDRASEHAVAISAVGAVCLLVVYARLALELPAQRREEPALESGQPRAVLVRGRDRDARGRRRGAPRSSRTGSWTRSTRPSSRSGSRRRSPGS